MIAYEIQTYSGGQWVIQAMFDDKELSLMEARRLRSTRPSLAVRVVEESYDANRNATSSRIVFRGSPVDDHNAGALERGGQIRREVEEWRTKDRARKEEEARTAKKGASILWIGALFVLIVGVGAAVLIGLSHYR